ncbi:unnamed protein product, partial [Schistosoma mattheei]
DQCAVVESVKAVSEVYSPVSGTIIEVNPDVEKNTKIINQSPLDEGTLCVFESSGCIQNFSVNMKSYFSKGSSENSAVNTSILHFRLQTPDFDYGVRLSFTKYENTTTGNYYKAHFDDKNVEVIFQQKPFRGLVDLKEDMICYKEKHQ